MLDGGTSPESLRNVFTSLLMFYFIMKHAKMEQNNKWCVDSAIANLEVVLQLEYINIYKILKRFELCSILTSFFNFSES